MPSRKEYCELVLNNWVGYELQEDFVVSRDTAQLVQPVARFMATPDEVGATKRGKTS